MCRPITIRFFTVPREADREADARASTFFGSVSTARAARLAHGARSPPRRLAERGRPAGSEEREAERRPLHSQPRS